MSVRRHYSSSPILRPLVLAVHVAVAVLAVQTLFPQVTHAADAATEVAGGSVKNYQIAAGSLTATLGRYAAAAGIALSFDPALTAERQSAGLQGNYTIDSGFAKILSGTGLEVVRHAGGGYTMRRISTIGAEETVLPEVSVQATTMLLPPVYAGGQVARGSRMGLFGNADVFETPFSTQTFTEEFVRDQQSRRISDIVAVDPSVRSPMAEYGDTETFSVRGFPLFTSQVGVNGLYGMTDSRRITPEFYERVDMLKGPASMLLGVSPFGVVGGNMNLVSKRAGDVPLTRITGSYVSDSQFGGHVDISRRFGEQSEWGIRANLLERDGDTPIRNQKDRMSNQAVTLDYRGSRFKASLDLTSQKRKTDGQSANITYNQGFALPRPPKNDHNFANDWEFIDTSTQYWMAAAEYEFSPAVTVYANYGQSKNDEEYFYAASQMRRFINSNGDFEARVGGFRGASDVKTYEIGLRGELKAGAVSHRYSLSYSDLERLGHGLTVHASGVYKGNVYQTPSLPRPTLAYGPLLQTGDLRLSSVGLINTLGFFNDTVLLTVGVRDQKIYSGTFTGGVKAGAYDVSKVTPALALLVKSGKVSYYGNYSEGVAQGATAPNAAANSGTMLPPAVTKQIETGIKYNAGTFGLTAALFQIRQPSTYINGSNIFVADGEQRNRGIELSTFGQPWRGIRLLGGLTLMDAVQTQTANGINDGKQAIGVPKVNLVLNGEYDVSSFPGLTLTGRISAFSGAQADVGNTQSIPGWVTMDTGARYLMQVNGKAVTLRANILNLADRSYWNSVTRSFITMGAPRTLLLSASVDF